MKIQKILFIIIVLLVELSVMGPFFSTYFLTILVAATLYIALNAKIEEALILIFILGFVVDIASFNRFPLTTTLLLLELATIYFAKRKIVDFKNPASIFLFIVGFSLLRFLIASFIFDGFTNQIAVVYSILLNISFSMILSVVIYKTMSLGLLNEKK